MELNVTVTANTGSLSVYMSDKESPDGAKLYVVLPEGHSVDIDIPEGEHITVDKSQ